MATSNFLRVTALLAVLSSTACGASSSEPVDASSDVAIEAGIVDARDAPISTLDAGEPPVLPDGGPPPAWLKSTNVDQWVEIPNSSMSNAPVGLKTPSTDPKSRMDAWNGYALKGTDVYSVRQGGHTDYYGNEVLRFSLAADAPAWVMVKDSTKDASVVTLNSSRYLDGTPAAVHGYYTQRYIPQRNWILSVGTTAMSANGGTNGDCVVYDIGANAYLAPGTVPDRPPLVTAECGVWQDDKTGDVYYTAGYEINKWSQATNTWIPKVAQVPKQYGLPSVACADTKRRRAIIMGGDLNTTLRQPYLYDMSTSTASELTFTGDLTLQNSVDGKYGLVYVPAKDRFYGMIGGAGGTGLYEIDPVTFKIAGKTTTGGAGLPAGNTTGVFTRFLYVAELGGIVYFPRYSANAWFLRLH